MRQAHRWAVGCVGFLVGLGIVGGAGGAAADNEGDKEQALPAVFQAAGPTAAAIQSTVDAFRAALGDPNNANAPGPLATGRREINWDGGGNNDTTAPLPPANPFDVFLDSRGARFTTPGTGLTQGPPDGGPQGGLAALFDNPTYGDIFSPFSPLRLFAPVGSNFVDGRFFIPGTNGAEPAAVKGFGAVFTDVDRPAGSLSGDHLRDLIPRTLITYFDADGQELFTGVVPASPGDGSLSFFGVVFAKARVARIRIISGSAAPGPDDDTQHDIVVMDDFLYGEPQPLD